MPIVLFSSHQSSRSRQEGSPGPSYGDIFVLHERNGHRTPALIPGEIAGEFKQLIAPSFFQ